MASPVAAKMKLIEWRILRDEWLAQEGGGDSLLPWSVSLEDEVGERRELLLDLAYIIGCFGPDSWSQEARTKKIIRASDLRLQILRETVEALALELGVVLYSFHCSELLSWEPGELGEDLHPAEGAQEYSSRDARIARRRRSRSKIIWDS